MNTGTETSRNTGSSSCQILHSRALHAGTYVIVGVLLLVLDLVGPGWVQAELRGVAVFAIVIKAPHYTRIKTSGVA